MKQAALLVAMLLCLACGTARASWTINFTVAADLTDPLWAGQSSSGYATFDVNPFTVDPYGTTVPKLQDFSLSWAGLDWTEADVGGYWNPGTYTRPNTVLFAGSPAGMFLDTGSDDFLLDSYGYFSYASVASRAAAVSQPTQYRGSITSWTITEDVPPGSDVPEPSSAPLVALGLSLAGAVVMARRFA